MTLKQENIIVYLIRWCFFPFFSFMICELDTKGEINFKFLDEFPRILKL